MALGATGVHITECFVYNTVFEIQTNLSRVLIYNLGSCLELNYELFSYQIYQFGKKMNYFTEHYNLLRLFYLLFK